MTHPGSEWRSLFTAPLAEASPDIGGLIERQARENASTVNLVASESYCPRATLEAEASVMVNKNASGYPPRVSFAGGEVIDAIETLAIERAKRLFGAEYANVQALSSTIANVAVLRALLRPGDRILAFDREAGGHSSHGSGRHLSGQDYAVEWFGLDSDGRIDYDGAGRKAAAFRPRMVIAGSSAYPWNIDFAKLRSLADECGALLFADIAHVSGLIAAGLLPNPVPACDVATTSTHKTFCGPRTGGLILCRARYGPAIDAALAPGLQAAPGAHIIAARAALFELAGRPAFRKLMERVLAGASRMARSLLDAGIPLFAGGTDTHMVVVDLRHRAWDERALNVDLERHGIVANTTTLPCRVGGASTLGLRIGSTPMAIRGMDLDGFAEVAGALAERLAAGPGAPHDDALASRMRMMAAAYPIPFGGLA